MARKKMVMVAVEDLHTVKVGSLGEFQHKRRMANEPAYRAAAKREQNRPKTFSEVLGIGPEPVKEETLVVDGEYGQMTIRAHPILHSMNEMFGLPAAPSMRTALGLG